MLRVGDVIADRFVLNALAGQGGMGTVFKAHDRANDAVVAVKILDDPDDSATQRFLREAEVLASLAHDHIVAYRGHGVADSGHPWLAMEWLEGEDLATRLIRGRLTVEESLELLRCIAFALQAAHARGIIHRDIKPSNLFLPHGNLQAVKVLDFGIAGGLVGAVRLTATHTILGTPGYMAPEQARGEGQVTPAADIFSLGCVLFECLAGKPAFVGTHYVALLAKVLLAEPPKLADERPEVPRTLLRLCDRMMSKDSAGRFADGGALVNALSNVVAAVEGETVEVRQSSGTTHMSTEERRLVSVVVVRPSPIHTQISVDRTKAAFAGDFPMVQRIVEPFGGRADLLADGTLLVSFMGSGNAVDQAALAARSALRLRIVLPGLPMVLVTGHSDATSRFPMGAVMDRAADLLTKIPADETRIYIDDDTRSLVELRFSVKQVHHISYLHGLGAEDESRVLLGKPSPFVGRERELSLLLETVEEGFDERVARAIVVTAPAGTGKSRLRQEFLRRLRKQRPDLASDLACADVMGDAAAFSLIGSTFRQSLNIQAGEPIEIQRSKIADHVSLVVDAKEADRVTEFLCELVGAPFPDERSVRLRAARKDGQVMANQIESAYIDFLRGVVKVRPIVIVVEDLHWADMASVKLLDTVLRELGDEPIAIVAFARPEVEDRFPRLWASRKVQDISLRPLSRKAASDLVRGVLGQNVDPTQLATIVDRAAGNAFFLEELIRSVAEGHSDTLPETVIGMVEARIGALEPISRLVLRAASVLGSSFWTNGVRALLGEDAHCLDEVLPRLVDQEFVTPAKTKRFAGEEEYVFRHALVREGAYAMLTERDKQVGHALAGAWLERVQEPDALILATHFEQGGERERAAFWFVRLAERAYGRNDLSPALEAAKRSLALVPEGEHAGKAWGLCAGAALELGDNVFALSAADEGLRRTRPGSEDYCQALSCLLYASLFLQQHDRLSQAMGVLAGVDPEPAATSIFVRALSGAQLAVTAVGQRDPSAFYLQKMQQLAARHGDEDPLAMGFAFYSEAYWCRLVEGNSFMALTAGKRGEQYFELAGQRQFASMVIAGQGSDAALIGAFDEAMHHFIRARKIAPTGLTALFTQLAEAIGHLYRGAAHEAASVARATRVAGQAQGEALITATAQLVLADALIMLGELDAAEEMLGVLDAHPGEFQYRHAHGVRARLLLARGRIANAVDAAKETVHTARTIQMYGAFYYDTLLTYAEALMAANERDAARKVIAEARDELLAQADRIDDESYRKGFLECVVVHARTLALAKEWLA